MAYDLKAILEANIIDTIIPVIVKGDKELEKKMAKLGTKVGAASKFADLPTVDQNGAAVGAGDTATLTTKDGDNPAGLYEYDGTKWVLAINYDAMGIDNILELAKANDDDTTSDDKFTTPKQVTARIKAATDAATAALKAQADLNKTTYHPKGGDVALKVVGAPADEKTDEFVTAKQLDVTFTTAEVQAKYDAL